MGKKTETIAREKEALGARQKSAPLTLIHDSQNKHIANAPERVAFLSKRSLELLKGMLNESLSLELSDNEFGRVAHYAEKHRADPLTGEMWCQIRWSKKKGRDGKDVLVDNKPVYERRLIMGLSKHQVQKRLEAHADFGGLQSGVVYEKDEFSADLDKGEVHHKVTSIMRHLRGMQVAAWCRIERNGKTPYLRLLYLSERAQTDWNTGKLMGMWAGMTDTMIQKCVEMDTVRACYPSDFADVFDQDEMPPETLKPADFVEVTPSPTPQADTCPAPVASERLPDVPAEVPSAPAFDTTTEPDGSGGAFVTRDQWNATKALMQEFHLRPEQMQTLIENTFSAKIDGLNKLRKPQYAQLALRFGRLREGEIALGADLKWQEPPEAE